MAMMLNQKESGLVSLNCNQWIQISHTINVDTAPWQPTIFKLLKVTLKQHIRRIKGKLQCCIYSLSPCLCRFVSFPPQSYLFSSFCFESHISFVNTNYQEGAINNYMLLFFCFFVCLVFFFFVCPGSLAC